MPGPQPSDGFHWTQAPFGPVLQCGPLLQLTRHFFTTSSLELKDDPEEWRAIAAFAGVAADRLRLLHQVHGRTVVVASTAEERWIRPDADAVISDDPDVALVVRVADCAPILMADRRSGAVAAVHAGWRSTMQRIAEAAVTSMRDTFGTKPCDLLVAVGPALGTCCGEMGEEVVDAFRAAGHDTTSLDRWFVRSPGRRPHFDLWQANRDQLAHAGVPAAAVHLVSLCTRTNADVFHSYRAAGQAAGRMAAVIRANP